MKFREELPLVGQFYLFNFIFWIALGIMAGYWTLYFQSQGLSFTLIGLVFMVNALAMFIFEIPTGAIADVLGRKISVTISYLLLGVAYFGMFLYGSNLTALIILNILTGLAYTLESGALEAWFVDTVKHKRKDKDLHHLLGRWGSIANVGFIFGPLLGGFLVAFGYDKALLATAISITFLGLLILVIGKEHYFKRKALNFKSSYKQTVENARVAIKYVKNNNTILLLTIISLLLVFGLSMFYNAYQPYVVSVGLNPSYIGYALSIAGFLVAIQLNYSKKITKFLGGNRKSLIVYGLSFVVALFLVPTITFIPALFLILVLYTSIYDMSGNMAPAFKEIKNNAIPSNIRASVLSVSSGLGALALVLAHLSFGFLSDTFSPRITLYLGVAFTFAAVLLYFKLPKD